MPNKKGWILVKCCIAAATMMTFGACSTTTHPTSDRRSAGRIEDDKHLKENVEAALRSDPIYKFESVDVSTFAGVVQLSGFVDSEEQKTRADEIAKQVSGASQVVNGLTLKPQPVATPTGPGASRVYSE